VKVLFRVAQAGAGNTYAPASDGTRLYADVDRQIQAFDLSSGALLWSYRRPRGGPSALVPRAGRLFFAGDTAVALDAATGRELWRYVADSSGQFCESDGDAEAFYFGTVNHRVYALRAADGALLWSRDLGPDWPYEGVVRGMTVSGDTVYAAVEHETGVNGHIGTAEIWALDRRTGAVHWTFREGDGSDLRLFQSAVRVAGRVLLAVEFQRNVFIGVDRFTGREAWRIPGTAGIFAAQEPPEVVNGVAYGVSEDGRAISFDPATGAIRWRTNGFTGAAYVAVCGSRVLVNNLALRVLDSSNGNLLASAYTDGELPTTDFVIVGNRAYTFTTQALVALECPA
jgi:outer membrane protein assembly factor BamB